MPLSAPQSLSVTHLLDGFDCGEPSLNDWLKQRALTNHLSGASRTFVVVDANQCVLGYYALAAGAVAHQQASSAIRRNMPDPVPVMVLARLAVDTRAQGIKLGAALLQDSVTRVRSIAENAGVRALLVHALNERAKQFYEHYGFRASPMHPMTLMLSLKRDDITQPQGTP
ncbi:MAG: GNAT family N-acetyltransferase [Azoarcus sp.]|nr:GNAT family N-acetyltransferase [Azoarcus sp.]